MLEIDTAPTYMQEAGWLGDRVAAPGLTIEDWEELLNLDGMVQALVSGQSSPDYARSQLAARRQTYPGLQLDYVRVLDVLAGFVDKVSMAVDDQNETLEKFNRAVEQFGVGGFDYDQTRLLTRDERIAFAAYQAAVEEKIRQAAIWNDPGLDDESADELAALQEEAESLEQEIDAVQSEIDELQSQLDDDEDGWD